MSGQQRPRRKASDVTAALEAVNVERLWNSPDGMVCRCRDCGRRWSKVSYGEKHTECSKRAPVRQPGVRGSEHNSEIRSMSDGGQNDGDDVVMSVVEEQGQVSSTSWHLHAVAECQPCDRSLTSTGRLLTEISSMYPCFVGTSCTRCSSSQYPSPSPANRLR